MEHRIFLLAVHALHTARHFPTINAQIVERLCHFRHGNLLIRSANLWSRITHFSLVRRLSSHQHMFAPNIRRQQPIIRIELVIHLTRLHHPQQFFLSLVAFFVFQRTQMLVNVFLIKIRNIFAIVKLWNFVILPFLLLQIPVLSCVEIEHTRTAMLLLQLFNRLRRRRYHHRFFHTLAHFVVTLHWLRHKQAILDELGQTTAIAAIFAACTLVTLLGVDTMRQEHIASLVFHALHILQTLIAGLNHFVHMLHARQFVEQHPLLARQLRQWPQVALVAHHNHRLLAEQRLQRLEQFALLRNAVVGEGRQVNEVDDAAVEMCQRGDGLHLNRVALRQFAIENARTVNDLIAQVVVVAVSHVQ
mmetsp:Transcript_10965/g.16564  ORF Transcript_10965/g.16564 Transcript_10965/m.16564 type:complete len:360 (-) Transcript_10965:535-1614(-)